MEADRTAIASTLHVALLYRILLYWEFLVANLYFHKITTVQLDVRENNDMLRMAR